MDADAPNLGPALLRWANMFKLDEPIDSWQKLQDGQVLWKILEFVDPDYFSGKLPEPVDSDNWIPRWQNLKHIDRMVVTFIRDECGELQETTKMMDSDVKAIATEGSEQETKKLVKAALLASMYSRKSNQQTVQIMTQLGVETSAPIASWIQFVKTNEQKQLEIAAQQAEVGSDVDRISSPEPERAPQPTKPLRDPELENEEKLMKAYASIQDLEQKNTLLINEMKLLRENAGKLENDLTETKYQLERGVGQGSREEFLDELERRTMRDRDYIAELETEVETARNQLETQERQMERFRMDSEEKQRLKEELREIRLERDELSQTAKANENLRKKIQALQDSDKNNQTLRQELETARQDLKTLEIFKNRCLVLQKTNEEHMKLIQNGEQAIFDSKMAKKRLEHDLKMTEQRYEAAKDRAQRDNDQIQELQDKVRELESGGAPVRSRVDDEKVDSLNDEFTTRDSTYKELQQKVEVLEAEIARQRNTPDTGESSEIEHLQNQIKIYQERIKSLEQKYMDTLTENMGLDVKAHQGGEEGAESQKAFAGMRDRLNQETEKATDAEKRLFDAESEISDLKVKLQESQAKLAAVDKNETEKIGELKKSNALETDLLKAENERLRNYDKKQQGDLEELRSLFRLSIVDRGSSSNGLEPTEELKLITAQLQTILQDNTRLDEVAIGVSNRIVKGREQIAQERAQTEQVLLTPTPKPLGASSFLPFDEIPSPVSTMSQAVAIFSAMAPAPRTSFTVRTSSECYPAITIVDYEPERSSWEGVRSSKETKEERIKLAVKSVSKRLLGR